MLKSGLSYSLLGFEIQAVVFWRSAVVTDKFLAKLILDLDEVGLVVRSRQTLRQTLELWGQSVVGLVS